MINGSFRTKLLFVIILFTATMSTAAASVSVIIEDENGNPTPARVYLLDAKGVEMFPSGVIRYEKVRTDGMSEKDFVPPEGTFTIDLPTGTYRVTIERGKEYLPETRVIDVSGSGNSKEIIRLRRWVDMAGRGWFSADMHVHRGLSELLVLMEAEDLSVAIPITRWKTVKQTHQDPDLDRFLAFSDHQGIFHFGKRFFPVLNEELEPRSSAVLASGFGRRPIPLEYPLARFGQAIMRAGGISDSEKLTSLELPALAALGVVQTVGLANNHLWRSGSYSGAWGAWPNQMLDPYPQTCNGFAQAGFDMYSALLNLGFPIKLSAGSASGVHPVPPGWSRVYVRTGTPLTPQAWFAGLRAGRSFVTTGPMLFLEVNGQQPGNEIRGIHFPLLLQISIQMQSISPITNAEVVMNGEVHSVALTPQAGEPYTYRGSLTLIARTSSWITARWLGKRGNSCDVAHTSPIYVWNGNAPVPISRQDIEVLQSRVSALIDQVHEKRNVTGDIVADTDELREKTLQYLRQAQEVYRQKLSGRLVNSK